MIEVPAPLVGIVMGSQSDWATMRSAADMLDQLEMRLRQLGYTVLSEGEITGMPTGLPGGAIDGAGDRGQLDPDLRQGSNAGADKRGVL